MLPVPVPLLQRSAKHRGLFQQAGGFLIQLEKVGWGLSYQADRRTLPATRCRIRRWARSVSLREDLRSGNSVAANGTSSSNPFLSIFCISKWDCRFLSVSKTPLRRAGYKGDPCISAR